MPNNQGCIVSDFLPNRVDKALAWLERSRDTWKDKCMQTKLLLKRQTFAVKRLKEGRNSLRLSTIRLKVELSQCKDTISALQKHIKNLELQAETSKSEANKLKKKSSRTM